MTTLKPCPFCGGERLNFLPELTDPDITHIGCLDCEGMARGDTRDLAISVWNTRPSHWRKWPEEKPDESGQFVVTDDRVNPWFYAARYDAEKRDWSLEEFEIWERFYWMLIPELPGDNNG